MEQNRLTALQIELLKSVQYLANEEQIAEVKSLLRYYFLQKLEGAISAAETHNHYTAEIYAKWLQSKAADAA